MLKTRTARGDTIVEVLFAVSVFSLVVVGALGTMNRGVAISQRALESTLVRQQMDSQAETLRFMHDAYLATYKNDSEPSESTNPVAYNWYKMMQYVSSSGAESATTYGTCPTVSGGKYIKIKGSFFVNPKTAEVVYDDNTIIKPTTWSGLEWSGSTVKSAGMWIEAVRSTGNTADVNQSDAGYVDFHIRACWDTVGMSQQMTLGTIVRLYEPK